MSDTIKDSNCVANNFNNGKEEIVDDWESNAKLNNKNVSSNKNNNVDEITDTLETIEIDNKPKKKEKETQEVISNGKEHYNIIFIGHVDAGKSTIGGQLLYLTGQVDQRTLEKYEREAKDKNRDSWYLSYALDTNPEEREKGKTVEVGRAFFETKNKHWTLLDAPGHKGFVPNMISGASQADLAVLVISARKGEFETGFERGGQTREHALLVKTTGAKHLIVLINKMDDPTVKWEEARFNECKDKLLPFLKRNCNFNPKNEIYFMPCSGLQGDFLRDCPPETVCSWYRGPSFLDYIDSLANIKRNITGPFRLPIVDKYKDMGTVVFGKVESGSIRRGQNILLMPNRKEVEVLNIWIDEDEVACCQDGQNVKIKLKGVEEEEVTPGFVLCDPLKPCSVGRIFDVQVATIELKSILSSGYSAVLHMHTTSEEVTVKKIFCKIDKKTQQKIKTNFVKQDEYAIMRFECKGGLICMETFKDFPQMGRFTLRDEGKTVAIGKVLKVVE